MTTAPLPSVENLSCAGQQRPLRTALVVLKAAVDASEIFLFFTSREKRRNRYWLHDDFKEDSKAISVTKSWTRKCSTTFNRQMPRPKAHHVYLPL